MKVINEIATSKEIRIENNTQDTQDWFLELKKSKLHTDEEINKQV